MIYVKNLSGYMTNSVNITYVSFYSSFAETTGLIRFYPKPLDNVTDVCVEMTVTGLDICIICYPHNDRMLFEKYVSRNADNILKVFKDKVSPIIGMVNSYTVSLDDATPKLITPEDFTEFNPKDKDHNVLWMVESSNDLEKFPQLYFATDMIRKSNTEDLVGMFALLSRSILKSESRTVIGKEFVFLLSNAFLNKKPPKNISAVGGLSFPSMNAEDVDFSYTNIEKLSKVFLDAGADKIIVTENGIVSSTSFDEKLVTSLVDTSGDKELEDIIVKSILDKNSIRVSDLASFGLSNTLKLIGETEQIIKITADLIDDTLSVKKMCIYKGKVHIVTDHPEIDINFMSEFFDESEELFVADSLDTFPTTELVLKGVI